MVEEIVGVMAWTNKAKGNTHSNDVDSHFDACRHDIEQRLNSTVGNGIRSGECYNKLALLDKGNAEILMNYVLAYKHESDVADSTLTTGLLNLLRFAVKVNKPFGDITREDLLGYLGHMKNSKPGSVKWKRTSNLFLIHVTSFFK